MTTKLVEPLKREIEIDGVIYIEPSELAAIADALAEAMCSTEQGELQAAISESLTSFTRIASACRKYKKASAKKEEMGRP
jgi:hypothetical protein